MGFQFLAITATLFFTGCTGPLIETTDVEVSKPQTKEPVSGRVFSQADEVGVFDDRTHSLQVNLSDWKLIADSNGIQTYEKIKSNSGLVAFRGETVIQASMAKLVTVLNDDSLQKEWVDSYVESKSISKKNDFDHVEYNQTKVPWPFQNRDFVFRVIAKVHASPPTMLITMKSTEHPEAPVRPGIVRGEIVQSYYYLKEIPGLRATKMVVEMEVDPKGAIPLWLVTLSQRGWPENTLASLRKIAMKDNIPVNPKILKYFAAKKITPRNKK